MAKNSEEIIRRAYEDGDIEVSADVMSELLMDDNWSTWKMFEGLASDYLNGSADVRKGIDLAISAVTGWNLDTIAQTILDRCYEDIDEEDEW